jgi:predicted metalloprotease with PDZ domain
VVVLRAEPESPAARAGLEGTRVTADGEVIVGDVILAVDDRPVTRVGELIEALETYTIGDRVDLVVYRRGEVRTVPVVLGSSSTPAAGRLRRSAPPLGSLDRPGGSLVQAPGVESGQGSARHDTGPLHPVPVRRVAVR